MKTLEVEEAYSNHQKNKNMAREEKIKDKLRAEKDNTFCAIIGDLEAVTSCPKSESADFYYASKISCYNYSIYNLGNKDGYCYRWNELKAKQGKNEIGSCLIHFLNEVVPCDVKEVFIWADTCGGQNRNQYTAAVLISIIEDPTNSIKKITQKFYESGHSQSEVDTIHSTLEDASGDLE